MIDKNTAELAKTMGTAYLNCCDEVRPPSCILVTPDSVTMIMRYYNDTDSVEVQIYWGRDYREGSQLLTLTREG